MNITLWESSNATKTLCPIPPDVSLLCVDQCTHAGHLWIEVEGFLSRQGQALPEPSTTKSQSRSSDAESIRRSDWPFRFGLTVQLWSATQY